MVEITDEMVQKRTGILRPITYVTGSDAWKFDKRRVANRVENHADIQTLQTNHRLIIKHHCQGRSNAVIAALMGLTVVRVKQILNSPLGKMAIEKHMLGIEFECSEEEKRVSGMVMSALDVIENGMKGRMTVEVGEGDEKKVVEQVVPVRDRLGSAMRVLDMNRTTAKVGVIKTEDEGASAGLVQAQVLASLKDRFDRALVEMEHVRKGGNGSVVVDVTPSLPSPSLAVGEGVGFSQEQREEMEILNATVRELEEMGDDLFGKVVDAELELGVELDDFDSCVLDEEEVEPTE